MKLFYEDMVTFFNLSPTSSHLHPLQAENCDSNSRLVVNDDNVNSYFKGLLVTELSCHSVNMVNKYVDKVLSQQEK